MTVHSAKGLEFPMVFVAALHKGVETKLPVVTFSPRIGLGARWRNPAVRQDEEDLFQHEIHKERAKRESDESHRLLYVAMTRAEQHLVLSFSGEQPKEWAKLVADKLNLPLDTNRDELLTRTAPDGKPWTLRLLVTDRMPDLRTGPSACQPRGQHRTALPARSHRTAEQQRHRHGRWRRSPIVRASITSAITWASRAVRGNWRRRRKWAAFPPANSAPRYTRFWRESRFPSRTRKRCAWPSVFRQSPLGRRLERASRVEREFDFLMAVEDLVIRGQVDLWFEEGGELAIVDYKTDSVTAAEAHRRARDYALQLRLYALAVERFAGRAPDRAWLYFLRPNTVVEVDLTPSLLERPEQIVRDFEDAQSKLEFPLNEGERCHRCQFWRDLCPAGRA